MQPAAVLFGTEVSEILCNSTTSISSLSQSVVVVSKCRETDRQTDRHSMNIVVVDTVGRRRWLDRPLEERKGKETKTTTTTTHGNHSFTKERDRKYKKLWAHLQHSFFQLAAAGAPCVKAAAFNYCAYLRSTTKACSCLSLLNGGMVIYSLYVLIPPLASTPPALLWLHTSHIIVAIRPTARSLNIYIYVCHCVQYKNNTWSTTALG